MTYPDTYGACIVCGAAIGQPCDTVNEPGKPRLAPHFYRAKRPEDGPQGDFVAVRDEPGWGEKPSRVSNARRAT